MRFGLLITLLASLSLSAPLMAVEIGAPAPAISVKTLSNYSGAQIDLASLKGQVVYVDFWASWCGPCKKSFPELDKLYTKHVASSFEIVGINLDENTADADGFLKQHPVTFPLAADPKGVSAEQFKVKGMPSAYLLDKKGVVRHIVVGFSDGEAEHLDKLITQLVAE